MITKQSPVVWLIRPWIEDFSAFDHFDQPVGLLSLAAWLRQNGCRVYYIDALSGNKPPENSPGETAAEKVSLKLRKYPCHQIEKPIVFRCIPRYYKHFGTSSETLKKELESLPVPQVILITTGMTYWYQAVQSFVQVLQALYPASPIAIGGIYAGIVPEHARACLQRTTVFPGQAGQQFFSWMSKILGFNIHPPTDQDTILPAWDLVSNRSYIIYTTSRGCLRRCSYCAASLLRPVWKARPPNVIRNEIEALITQYQVSDIALYDDDLGCSTLEGQQHLTGLLQMLVSHEFPINWHLPNALGVDAVTPEVARLMYQAGFEQPRLSLHHLDKHLDEKGLDTRARKAFETAAKRLVEAGYEQSRLSTYLIAGLPGQKLSWLKKAADQLLDVGVKPYLAQFSPIPGTPAGEKRLQQLTEKFKTDDLLLTNKIFSVYAHDGWSEEDYQMLVLELKNR